MAVTLKAFDEMHGSANPFSGELRVNINAIIKNSPSVNNFVNGTNGYEQVFGITIGKQYTITKIIGYGDVFDVCFINDAGEEDMLGMHFFEDVETRRKVDFI